MRLALLEITFLFIFLSPEFHELWHSGMTTSLITEVKQQWATLVLGWVTASVHHSCLMALRLMLVDGNPLNKSAQCSTSMKYCNRRPNVTVTMKCFMYMQQYHHRNIIMWVDPQN